MVYLFLLLVLTTPFNISQAESINFDSQITVADSAVSGEVSQETLLAYQEILEKTNQQLSLWWNPYGLMIAGLGVLFTILTIIAAAIIYFQGKGAKQLLNESIERHAQILNEYIEQKNQEMKSLITSYSQELKKLKEQVPESEDREEFLSKLDELDEKLEKLSGKKVDSVLDSLKVKNLPYSDFKVTGVDPFHVCSKCRHIFMKPYTTSSAFITSTQDKTIECPECGNTDKV